MEPDVLTETDFDDEQFPYAEVAEADELDQLMFDPPRCCNSTPCLNGGQECPR